MLVALAGPAAAAPPGAPKAAPGAAPAAAVKVDGDEEWKFPEQGLLVHPAGPGKGKDRLALGGVWQVAPMFTAHYRRGLGAGFSWDGELRTVLVYNQLTVGATWATEVGPFHLGVMAHAGGFYGLLGKALIATTEFNSTGWGILLNPGLLAGMQVARDSWLTLQLEGFFSPYQASKLGDLVITAGSPIWEGAGASLVVEYAPTMKSAIYYGISLYHTRTNFPIWFNVEASPSSAPFSSAKIWYLGYLAGYEF